MTTDRPGEPWSGMTYRGFAGTTPASPPPGAEAEPPTPEPGLPRNALFGGVAVALAAGVLFGVIARPDLAGVGAKPEPAPAATTAQPAPAPAAATVPIEVAQMAPAPVPKATDKLEVLPRDMARAAPPPAPAVVLPPPPPLAAERVEPPRPAPPA